MRVLHVIPSVAPRYGGPSFAVVEYCRALRARGVETLIATTNADGEGTLPVVTGGVTEFRATPAIFFARRGEAFKYSGALSRWLRDAVSAFDVVHIHAVFSHASLAAGRACRAHGIPYLVRPLGSLDPWSLTQGAWKKRLLLRTSARALIAGAAAIHFTTDEECRLAAAVTAGVPGVVIPPGVDAEWLQQTPGPAEQREKRVVALTRLDPKKRLDALIDSFHAIAAVPEFAAWRLVIAGDGPVEYRDQLQGLAAAGPAGARIEFPGWIDGPAKRHLLRTSAIFALPSHQENFGLALVEALACGLPAIVSRAVNLAPEVQAAGAGWILADTDQDLTKTLMIAMRDSADRAQRSTAATHLASRFSWPAAAAQLEAQYASMRSLSVGARL